MYICIHIHIHMYIYMYIYIYKLHVYIYIIQKTSEFAQREQIEVPITKLLRCQHFRQCCLHLLRILCFLLKKMKIFSKKALWLPPPPSHLFFK